MEENENIIELEDESGKKIEFEFLANMTVDENNYIVLYPVDDEGDDAGVVILKQVESSSEDENEYVPIEDENEAEKVFQEFLNSQEDEDEE